MRLGSIIQWSILSVKASNVALQNISVPNNTEFVSAIPVSTFEVVLGSARSPSFSTVSGMSIRSSFATGRVEARRDDNANVRGICGCPT